MFSAVTSVRSFLEKPEGGMLSRLNLKPVDELKLVDELKPVDKV